MAVQPAKAPEEYADLEDVVDEFEELRPQRHNIVFEDGWPATGWYSTRELRRQREAGLKKSSGRILYESNKGAGSQIINDIINEIKERLKEELDFDDIVEAVKDEIDIDDIVDSVKDKIDVDDIVDSIKDEINMLEIMESIKNEINIEEIKNEIKDSIRKAL
ncbi:MAG: hypothetical protein GX757_05275 [Clostridiales bacterium]|nr:hypothetical protein [Clostridiales bacterium]